MAEEEQNEQSVADALTSDNEGGSGGVVSKILRLALPVGILVLAAGAGYFANQMTGGLDSTPSEATAEEDNPPPPADDKEYKYFDLEPIVANPNVPRLERYIRATLTLAIHKDDYDQAKKVLEKRMPELKNSLILYLSDCSLDEIRGKKNLNRILREVQDSFNERLWPDQRGLIAKVGYKEWVIQ
jgi:flagellar basal body-associated protein FliL